MGVRIENEFDKHVLNFILYKRIDLLNLRMIHKNPQVFSLMDKL